MSSIPNMSQHPIEKAPAGELPVFRIDESAEELVVGGAPKTKSCFFSRFRCAKQCNKDKKRCMVGRAIRWLMTIFLVLGVVGFFHAKSKMHCMIKAHPIVCVPYDKADSTIELSLASPYTRIGIHPSLLGGDVHVVHSDEVSNGTVAISFDLAKDAQVVDDELFVCHLSGPKVVGAGIRNKDRHVVRPKVASVTIKLSSAEAGTPRGVILVGKHRRPGWFHRKIRKVIKKKVHKAMKVAVEAQEKAKLETAEGWQVVEHVE